MALIINKLASNALQQGKMLVENNSFLRANVTNFHNIRYMPPNLSVDVVQIAAKPKKRKKIVLNPATLQALADKNLSLKEIASELNMQISTVRLYLQKYNIVTNSQKEFRLLRKYFSAKTRQEKATAFGEIDKYLEQIAKRELKEQKGLTLEDCLQDVRLRFFEIVNQSKKYGVSHPYDILRKISVSKEKVTPQVFKNIKDNRAVSDVRIDAFENADFNKKLIEYFRPGLSSRETVILNKMLNEGKTINEISETLGLNPQYLKTIIVKDLIPKARGLFEQLISNEL